MLEKLVLIGMTSLYEQISPRFKPGCVNLSEKEEKYKNVRINRSLNCEAPLLFHYRVRILKYFKYN